jgi:penicillin amidase
VAPDTNAAPGSGEGARRRRRRSSSRSHGGGSGGAGSGGQAARSGRRRRRSRQPSTLRKVMQFSGRVLGLLAVLAILGVSFAVALVYVSLPDASEDAKIPGLSAQVSITLDQDGIPRIAAATERDAAMALGWLHARDRMFQMDMMRRGAEGRLAEIAGPEALRLDRFARTMGLADLARGDLQAISADAREILQAYADGVNARLAVRGGLVAPEYLVLGEPEPWKPEHSLMWGRVMGLWLSGAFRRDLDRARLTRIMDIERVMMLWPEDESPGRPDLAGLLDPDAIGRMLAQVPRFGEDAPLPSSASNAWVVEGARTVAGAPLLANDPHLGFQAPILWYLARIELPGGRFRAGATAPGVPAMVIGRNESLAWGFTTTHSDTQDVFIERLVDHDTYQTPEGPRPFGRREELIEVRGRADPERLVVRSTRHGPVISDIEPQAGFQHDTVLAVAMANLAPQDTGADALLALNRATSLEAARAAAARFGAPPQNLLVAESSGRIAQYLIGRTPIRRGGDGMLPAPGWDGEADWTGFVPFAAMAHLENPSRGIIASANSRPAPPNHPVFLGRHWFGDWRLQRIRELLLARPKHDAAGFALMQTDTVSLFARELLPVLREVRPSPAAARAHAMLQDWDGSMAAEMPQPLLFHAWMRGFRRLALHRQGAALAEDIVGPEFIRFLLHPDGRGRAWCGSEGCTPLLARTLDEAVRALEITYGSEPLAWRWGYAHEVRLEHPLLRFIPVLSGLTRLEAPTGGDGETLSRGGYRGNGDRPYQNNHGAGLRAVFDLSTPDGVLVMIATGQSGHPMSDHWGGMLSRWASGQMIRLGRTPEREAGRIRLDPG